MKKTKVLLMIIILLFYSEKLFSFLFYDYSGDYLEPWKIQAYYKEKYFEYNFYYGYYNFFDNYVKGDEEKMLSGMKQNFGLRLGLPESYILSTDILYIFQKIDTENHNNVQAITFLIEKNPKNFFNLLFGLKIPLWNKEINNIRILTEKDKLNFMLGISYNFNYFFLLNKFFIHLEMPVYFDMDYKGELSAGGILGFNIYDDKEKQSVDLLLELSFNISDHTQTYSVVGVLIPQLQIKFYSDFEFKIGMQIPGYIENCFYHKYDKYLYIVKLNYLINSDNRKKDSTINNIQYE